MGAFVLALYEDRLAPAARAEHPAAPRVLYVREGDLEVSGPGVPAHVAAGAAWHGTLPCAVASGARGATVLRYELGPGARRAVPGGALLEHPLALDPGQRYLMR